MIFRYFLIVAFLIHLSACYTSSNDSLNYSDSKDIKKYYEVAKTESDPVKAYKDAFTQLRILHQKKTDIKTVVYDSCVNAALKEKINYIKNDIKLNVIDYGYLDYLINSTKENIEYAVMWNFMHSNNFNALFKPEDISDNNALTTFCLAHINKILDNRFTVIIYEEAKILPRTNKPNYVLGGFYEGYALLYDLKTHEVLCYFNYRVNNTSNLREDYTTEEHFAFEGMMLQLKKRHYYNLKQIVAEKLRLEPSQVNLGFAE